MVPPCVNRASRLAFALCIGVSSLAFAQTVVYNNGASTAAIGYNINGPFLSAASDFSLASATTFNLVRFWVGQSDASSTTVGWKIYENNAGAFGTQLYGGTVGTTQTQQGTMYDGLYLHMQTDFFVGAVALGAGAYWLEISTIEDERQWVTAAPSGSSVYSDRQLLLGTPISQNGQEYAYQLLEETTTPEPGSLVLLASGLIGIGLIVSRRRKLS